MKTFQIAMPVMLLLGLTTSAFAQNAAAQQQQRAFAQQIQKSTMKSMLGSVWNNDGPNFMVMELLKQDNFREGIGVSVEQIQNIQETMNGIGANLQNDPRLSRVQDEMSRLMMGYDHPFADDVPAETRKRFLELQVQMQTMAQNIAMEKLPNVINENLAPDQLKKVGELQISVMTELPFVSPSMFEALDLSGNQKQQLGGIKKEMEPEFEKMVDKMVEGQLKFAEITQNLLAEKLEGVIDPKEREMIQKNIADIVRKSHPELQRLEAELKESRQKLTEKLKGEMFDILTDAQRKRMRDLIDNPPDYIQKMMAQSQREVGVGNNMPNMWQPGPDSWQPGPNSWKPGDSMPEGYQLPRSEGRFPRNAPSE